MFLPFVWQAGGAVMNDDETEFTLDTPEVRALSPAAEGWIDDLELVTVDPTLPALLSEVGAVLIGYSELRDVQRAR